MSNITKVGYYDICEPSGIDGSLQEYAEKLCGHIGVTYSPNATAKFIQTELAAVRKDWDRFAQLRPELLVAELPFPTSAKQQKAAAREALKKKVWQMEQMMHAKIRLFLQEDLLPENGTNANEEGISNDRRAVRSAVTSQGEKIDLFPVDKTAQRVTGMHTPPNPRGITRQKIPLKMVD